MSMDFPLGDDGQMPGLLGDLLKVLGGSGGPQMWLESAKALAHGVATENNTDDHPDPTERIRLEELLPVANLHLEALSGSAQVAPGASVEVLGRGAYALRVLEGWAPRLEQVVRQPSRPSTEGIEGLDATMEQFLTQFATMMGPIFVGLQFGSAAGHLARSALFAYVLPIPLSHAGTLVFVPKNFHAFAEDWSLDVDQVRMLAVVHELVADRTYGHEGIATRLRALLDDAAKEAAAAQDGILEQLLQGGDPAAMQQLLTNPEALADQLGPTGPGVTSAQLSAAVAAVEGYIDHLAGQVLARVLGPNSTLAEAWYRARTTESRGEQAAAALFGIDRSKAQIDRGARFIAGVVERAGDEGLAQLVADGANLPTPSELDAPGLWLERLAIDGA